MTWDDFELIEKYLEKLERGVFEAPAVEVDHWTKKAIDLEVKLSIATDALERIASNHHGGRFQHEARETLAKVKGEK